MMVLAGMFIDLFWSLLGIDPLEDGTGVRRVRFLETIDTGDPKDEQSQPLGILKTTSLLL